MTDIVDLNLYKAKKETNSKLYNAATGEFCYTVEYRHNGRTFDFDIWAKSWNEAEQRLLSAKINGQVVGQMVERD